MIVSSVQLVQLFTEQVTSCVCVDMHKSMYLMLDAWWNAGPTDVCVMTVVRRTSSAYTAAVQAAAVAQPSRQ